MTAFYTAGGLVLLSLAAALTVAALAHPASLLGKALGWGPLRWLGVRSYGIYLWHYPVIVLTGPAGNTGGPDVLRAILQVTATIAIAALSWRFIEEPIRRNGLRRWWLQARELTRLQRLIPAGRLPPFARFLSFVLCRLNRQGIGDTDWFVCRCRLRH